MATYNYECECGEVTSVECPIGKQPKTTKCKCGKRASRKWEMTNVICRYSYLERAAGNPRVNRGKGRR